MCLHTGMTDAFVWDLDTPSQQVTGPAETREILAEIDRVFRQDIGHLIYSHKVVNDHKSTVFGQFTHVVDRPAADHASLLSTQVSVTMCNVGWVVQKLSTNASSKTACIVSANVDDILWSCSHATYALCSCNATCDVCVLVAVAAWGFHHFRQSCSGS